MADDMKLIGAADLRAAVAAGLVSEAQAAGLQALAHESVISPDAESTRVYCDVELDRLGPDALGFLQFMVSAGVLTPRLREVVLDRVSAVPRGPVALEDFKVLVLLVFWSLGEEPDALILDELFVADDDRVMH